MDNNQMCNCRRCNGIVHEIKRGDTLYNLSRLYNVSVGNILNANKGINPYNLMIGEKICIPMRVDVVPIFPNRRDGFSENETKDMSDYEMQRETRNYDLDLKDKDYENYDKESSNDSYSSEKKDDSYTMKDKYIQNERNMGYDVEYRTSEFDSISLKELVMNRDMSVSEFANLIKNYM